MVGRTGPVEDELQSEWPVEEPVAVESVADYLGNLTLPIRGFRVRVDDPAVSD